MATDLIDLTGHEQVAFCSDPETRAARGHRPALHGARPGPGRHALPPLRLDGPRPRRRAAPLPGHDEQERRRRASTTAAARPSSSATRTATRPRAAARLRPVRRVPRRALRHGLRRRHLRRRHGRRRRDDPVGDGGARPSAAAPATRRCSRHTASSRACGRRRSTCGASRPWPAAGSASPVSARWVTASPSTSSRTAPRSSSPTSTRMPCARSSAGHPGARGGRRRRGPRARRPRRVQPQRPGRRPRRPHRRGPARRGSSAAGPTTSSSRRARRDGRPAAGARHPLRARLPRQRRRCHPGQRRAARVRHGAGARRTATIFEHTLEVLRDADEDDVTPAVAADRSPSGASPQVGARPVAARGTPWAHPVGPGRLPGHRPASGNTPRTASPLSGTASPERLH